MNGGEYVPWCWQRAIVPVWGFQDQALRMEDWLCRLAVTRDWSELWPVLRMRCTRKRCMRSGMRQPLRGMLRNRRRCTKVVLWDTWGSNVAWQLLTDVLWRRRELSMTLVWRNRMQQMRVRRALLLWIK